MKNAIKHTLTTSALALTVACGGGGGGGSSTLAPFVSWDRVDQPGQKFEILGQALEVTVTLDPVTEAVVSSSAPAASSATLFGTLDTRGEELERGGISTSSGQSLSFNASQFDYVESEDVFGVSAENADETQALGILINGNFQSFGLWANRTSASSLTLGFYSVGATTSGSAVPTSGNASYSGIGAGLYSAGPLVELTEFASAIGATADFSSRSMSFTSSTREGIAPNFSGTLNWSPGASGFSGSVASSGSVMTGTATGSFYGPAAEEIGGTFALGSGGAGLIGAFGATR